MKKIRRPLLFNGLILSLLIYPIIMIQSIIILALDHSIIVEVLMVILLFSVIGFLSSSIGLIYSKKPYFIYKNKSIFVILSFIILIIIVVWMLIYIISDGFKDDLTFFVFYFICLIPPFLTVVGYLKAKQSNYQEQIIYDNIDWSKKENREKLDSLREANLITETEYLTLVKKF